MERLLCLAVCAFALVAAEGNQTGTTSAAPAPAAAAAAAAAGEWRSTGVCRKCKCEGDKVDCYNQGLTDFFSLEDWKLLQPMKPATVDLSENSFSNISAIAELPVRLLNLSRCGVEFIASASFRDLQQMTSLDLSHNKLTSAKLSPHAFEGRFSPSQYEPLAAMRALSLAHNALHSLHQDLFEHLPELRALDLSGNPLATLDHVTVIALSSLPMLEELRLRSCQLAELPDRLLHAPRALARLDLSDNRLRAVPQELAETKNLLALNLNQNPIVELDLTSEDNPGFPRLRKLQELHMCNMPALRRVGPGALAGLEALQRLHLSFNPALTHLDPRALARPDDRGETFDWPLVKELYLQSNNLSEIDSRLLSRWDLAEKVDVSDNPFLCDCSTQWMVDHLVPMVEMHNPNASEKMVCAEPVEMRGYSMRHLHDAHRVMRCLDRYGHRPERDGAILLGTLIGVLLSVPIVLSLLLLWRRGYCGWLGLRAPADVSRAFYKRAPAEDF